MFWPYISGKLQGGTSEGVHYFGNKFGDENCTGLV
jgi:hypothetical protein